MSRTPEELLKLASNYDSVATRALVVTAKKKEKKKLDPKAKVRNRGTVCVPAESAKDKKDHFPINDEGQARNALARVQQLSSAPWYKGSLEGLKALVARKVKAKYPSINVGGKDSKKKKASEYYDALLSKFAQTTTNPDGTVTLPPFKTPGQVRQPTSFQRGDGQLELPDDQGNFNVSTPGQPNATPPASKYPVRPEVREVQEYLINYHPDFAAKLNAVGGADGRFGSATQKAVMEHARNSNPEEALQACLKWAREAKAPKGGGIVRDNPF